MKYKIPHITYACALLISIFITLCTLWIPEGACNTIVASIGAGGIASVCVAWLLDLRITKIRAIENQRRIDEVMGQFIWIYRRLMWDVANECYGFTEKEETHSFRDWLSFLYEIAPLCPKEGQASIKTRCMRISGDITALQRQAEIFQSQSATFIFADFPDIEQSLSDFKVLWTHCWGTLKILESENYKAFCDTTYILYTDFVNAFPQYRDRFPDEYSAHSFKP